MGLVPVVRQAADGVVVVTVDDVDFALASGFTQAKIYYDTTTTGEFSSALSTVINLVENVTEYLVYDSGAATGRYYKAALWNGSAAGTKSAYRLYGSSCAYASSHDVRRELSASSGRAAISPAHGHTIWNMAEDASRMVDRLRHLEDGAYAATASATRYFDGNGLPQLWLPQPLVSVTTVSVEETDGTYTDWTANTDYFTWPYNEAPILRLDVNQKSTTTKSTWIAGQRRVKIVGVFGVSATPPDDIARAVVIQCARWYKRAAQGWSDTGGMNEAGQLQYVKKLDPDVQTLVLNAIPHEVRL